MARTTGRLAAAAIGLALLLAPRPAPAGQVTDMLGRTVAVPTPPRRVVSLAPGLTEIAYAVGAAAELVGVTDYCDFPLEAARKPRIGGIYTPNLEAILSLAPDLVLATTEGNREEDIRRLERLHVPVYVVHPPDLAGVLDSIERVGRVLGHAGEAERLVAGLRADAEGIARKIGGATRPRVLYVVWSSPLIVPGRDTLLTDLLRRAGGESVTADEPMPYPRLSLEEALARRPDRIVVARHTPGSLARHLERWPLLALFPAARAGRVGLVDGDLLHRSGPRIVEGVRALARLIHPELAW